MSADRRPLSLSEKLSSLRANYQNLSGLSRTMRRSEGKPGTVDSLFKVQKSSHGIKKSSSSTAKKHFTKADDKVSVEEQELELLRQFDFNADYGPCLGLSRIERWRRAEKFGFNPPSRVLDLIISHSDDDNYTQCIWYDLRI